MTSWPSEYTFDLFVNARRPMVLGRAQVAGAEIEVFSAQTAPRKVVQTIPARRVESHVDRAATPIVASAQRPPLPTLSTRPAEGGVIAKDNNWVDMTSVEQAAARVLGYQDQTWDKGEVPPGAHTTTCPSLRCALVFAPSCCRTV